MVANNDVPTGAACIPLMAQLPADWQAWSGAAAAEVEELQPSSPMAAWGQASPRRRRQRPQVEVPFDCMGRVTPCAMKLLVATLECMPPSPPLPLTWGTTPLSMQMQVGEHLTNRAGGGGDEGAPPDRSSAAATAAAAAAWSSALFRPTGSNGSSGGSGGSGGVGSSGVEGGAGNQSALPPPALRPCLPPWQPQGQHRTVTTSAAASAQALGMATSAPAASWSPFLSMQPLPLPGWPAQSGVVAQQPATAGTHPALGGGGGLQQQRQRQHQQQQVAPADLLPPYLQLEHRKSIAPSPGSTHVVTPSPTPQPPPVLPLFPAHAQQLVPPTAPQDPPSASAFSTHFLQYHTERQAELEQRAAEIELEARLDYEALHGSSAAGVAAAAATAGQSWTSFAHVTPAAGSGMGGTGASDEQGLLLPTLETFNSLRLQPGASLR